jgi:hypothetical protein
MINRRSLLAGLIAAPAVVRASALMALPRAPWPPLIKLRGALLCNGALLHIADYPELFAVMGEAYGCAPGRFRLPDLGQSVLGVGEGLKPLRYLVNAEPRWDMPIGALTLQGFAA